MNPLRPLSVPGYRPLFAAMVLTVFAQGAWALYLAMQTLDLGATATTLSGVVAWSGIGLLAGSLPAGVLADRVAKKSVIVGVLTVNLATSTTTSTAAIFDAATFWMLAVSAFIIGVHISLVTLAGIASTPVMGVVSDRVGRRPVIFTAMSLMTALIFLFLRFDTGAPLTVLLGFLGLFFFSVMPIITAAAMDQVDRGSEGSATALMFAGGSVIGALSPIAAGVIYSQWGFAGVVWFSGSLAATGAALAAFLPMDRRDAPVRGETAQ